MTTPEGAPVRIQKYLSQAGVASRREAERLILEGRIRVNGEVVRELGSRIRPGKDRVDLDGERVEEARTRWVLLHKPSGTLTTRKLISDWGIEPPAFANTLTVADEFGIQVEFTAVRQ